MTPVNSQTLLSQWEESYKKGLLSFWILLLLSVQEMYAYEMGSAIDSMSQGTMRADSNSIYRAMRRFTDIGLVTSRLVASDSGPARRYFSLTVTGRKVLKAFIHRNILVFQSPAVVEAIKTIVTTYGA
jgi:PadR family transcriptional regulator, regulatory protein PadR